jgi:ribonuclease HII
MRGVGGYTRKMTWIVGIDEVGRGPIAGPLAIGACAITPRLERKLRGIRDSKKLNARGREEWLEKIHWWQRQGELHYRVVFIHSSVIDRRGMRFALRTAVARALSALKRTLPNLQSAPLLLDGGLLAPSAYLNQQTLIKGDEREPSIALASIAAKVLRDRHMTRLAQVHLGYLFEKHKGYGTREHYKALALHGPSPIHRLSFMRSLHS